MCLTVIGKAYMVCHDSNWHQKSMEGILEVCSGGQCPPGGWPSQSNNLVSPSHDNSSLSWTVSAPVNGTAEPVEEMAPPVVRPKRCPTSSNPCLLPSWTVVCPSFTLLMMLLLPGWPTMGLNRIHKKKKKCYSKHLSKLCCITTARSPLDHMDEDSFKWPLFPQSHSDWNDWESPALWRLLVLSGAMCCLTWRPVSVEFNVPLDT